MHRHTKKRKVNDVRTVAVNIRSIEASIATASIDMQVTFKSPYVHCFA